MKKLFFIFLFTCISQLSYAYQWKNGSRFVFVDPLVWRVREGSAENWAQVMTLPGTHQSATLIDAPFKWNAGIRMGTGCNCRNDWDTVVYYTGYQTKATNHASGRVFSAFLGNFFANNTNGADFGPHYHDASIDWKFLFNTLDFELGHTYTICRNLQLRPFVGLKTAVINQNIDTNWQGPITTILGIDFPITTFSSATEKLKNDFWGMGPSIGLDTIWPICKLSNGSFNIFGNLSGALLWGHWSFKDIYQNNTPMSIAIHVSDINGGSSMARALMGIEWAGCIYRANINARLGYEAQVWFNQVQYYSLNMGRLNTLMSLQGGVLDFCFNF